MKKRYSLLALALASVFAAPAAFAQDADDSLSESITSVYDVTDTVGLVTLDGAIAVDARSGATVEQTQETDLNILIGDVNTSATLGESLDGANGNIGVNLSAGVGNAQANSAALSSINADDASVYASAMVFSDQTSMMNGVAPTWLDSMDASVTDGALANATGNIGVNVASGVGNAQGNAMAASTNSDGSAVYATGDADQFTGGHELVLDFLPALDMTASLDGGALAGASGNVGVNIASGVGNLQFNSLSLASAGSP